MHVSSMSYRQLRHLTRLRDMFVKELGKVSCPAGIETLPKTKSLLIPRLAS
jgi:hypothetical protein